MWWHREEHDLAGIREFLIAGREPRAGPIFEPRGASRPVRNPKPTIRQKMVAKQGAGDGAAKCAARDIL